MATSGSVRRGRRRARPHAGVREGCRDVLRHVPSRARRAPARRGLHEYLLRPARRPGRPACVRARARRRAGRDDGRRRVHAAGGRVHRRLRLANRGRDRQRAPAERVRRGRSGNRGGAARVTEVIVLAGTDERDLTQLDEYRAVGGYAQLERARGMTPAAVIDELNGANLRGRGGAFFATGRKMQFIPSKEQNPKPHYVCVNADESEPGTFKDREIMNLVPHRLIEGSLIAAQAVESEHVFIYIRGEYMDPFESLRAALDEVRDAKLLGGVTVVLHRGAGAYICGEESGLLESLEGKRGQARSRPPFPAVSGLYASPTLINNVETIATIPKVLELGGAEYAKI